MRWTSIANYATHLEQVIRQLERPLTQMGGQGRYLFFGSMPMVLLGAGLTFAPLLYAPYIYTAHVWGHSPATDQQLGGPLMCDPVSLYMIVIMSILFIGWMQQQEREPREEESRLDALSETDQDLHLTRMPPRP